ncbi:hypothetical protein V8C86DRAFT_2843186 [Haematococcus lacustris]
MSHHMSCYQVTSCSLHLLCFHAVSAKETQAKCATTMSNNSVTLSDHLLYSGKAKGRPLYHLSGHVRMHVESLSCKQVSCLVNSHHLDR